MDTLTRRKTFIAIAQHRQRLHLEGWYQESQQVWLKEALAPYDWAVMYLDRAASSDTRRGEVSSPRGTGQGDPAPTSADALALRNRGQNLPAQVRQLFRRYAAEDTEDLESLILLGKMELQQ